MAFDQQRPLDGTAPPRSILEAHHRTALSPAADQPETSGHHGDPHVVQTLQARAHDTVLEPLRGLGGPKAVAQATRSTLEAGGAEPEGQPGNSTGSRGGGWRLLSIFVSSQGRCRALERRSADENGRRPG
jgi:hypothetical protein